MEIWIDPLFPYARRVRRAPNERPGRFWRNVDRRAGSECWPWKGSIGSNGYGVFSIRGKQLVASRRAYELTFGPIPDGLFVLHSCDNRPCCNPAHLRVGTHTDNMRDMVSRDRWRGRGARKTQVATQLSTPPKLPVPRARYRAPDEAKASNQSESSAKSAPQTNQGRVQPS